MLTRAAARRMAAAAAATAATAPAASATEAAAAVAPTTEHKKQEVQQQAQQQQEQQPRLCRSRRGVAAALPLAASVVAGVIKTESPPAAEAKPEPKAEAVAPAAASIKPEPEGPAISTALVGEPHADSEAEIEPLPPAFLGGRVDGGATPALERGERLQEPVGDDPEDYGRGRRKRRREERWAMTWFPVAAAAAAVGSGGGGGRGGMYHEAGAVRPSVVAAATTAGDEGEGKEEEDAVLSRPATRRAYLSKDGTPLVWDAPTLLELRAGQHMLSRAVGVGSIRVSVLQKAVPSAILPSALSLAVEEGFLSMGEAAPAADTDRFDKGVLNSEQMQMMEEERLIRKVIRSEKQAAAAAAAAEAAAAAAAAEAKAAAVAAVAAEADGKVEGEGEGMDVDGGGDAAVVEAAAGSEGTMDVAPATAATADAAAAAAAAAAAVATTPAPEPILEPTEEELSRLQAERARYDRARAAMVQEQEQGQGQEQEQGQGQGQGQGRMEVGAGAGAGDGDDEASVPPAELSLVRPLESLRDYHSPEEARLSAVYRDLWERGLTVGCGSPYGADFTAYEGDPMAFHSFAAIIVKDASTPLSARELSAAVRLEQSVVKLLVYALCHELPDADNNSGGNNDDDEQCGKGQRQKGAKTKEKLLPPWAAPTGAAAATRFGPPRRRVGRFLIEYVTMRFISVTRRME